MISNEGIDLSKKEMEYHAMGSTIQPQGLYYLFRLMIPPGDFVTFCFTDIDIKEKFPGHFEKIEE